MNRSLSRSIVAAGACIGAGLALQPLYAEPSRHALALQSGELVLRGGVSIAFTLACAYCIHRIKAWAAERPVMPAPSQLFAVTQSYGPALAGEVARAQAVERRTEESDVEHQWHNAIIRFVVLGSMKRSFGWHAMKAHVDRPGWDCLTHSLADHGVLRIGHGRTPTGFTPGWYCRKVWMRLDSGELAPPCPADGELPDVRW